MHTAQDDHKAIHHVTLRTAGDNAAPLSSIIPQRGTLLRGSHRAFRRPDHS